MSAHKFTKAQAIDEITYRAIPRPRPPRDFDPGAARTASGAELKARAGEPKTTRKAPAKNTPKAPAVKPEPTVEQQVSKLITRAAQAQAGTVEGPGFVKRVINARKALLSAGDLAAQALAATEALASLGDAECAAVLAAAS